MWCSYFVFLMHSSFLVKCYLYLLSKKQGGLRVTATYPTYPELKFCKDHWWCWDEHPTIYTSCRIANMVGTSVHHSQKNANDNNKIIMMMMTMMMIKMMIIIIFGLSFSCYYYLVIVVS